MLLNLRHQSIILKKFNPLKLLLNSIQRQISTEGYHPDLIKIHQSQSYTDAIEKLKNKKQYQSDIIHSNSIQLLNTSLHHIFPSNHLPLDNHIANGTPIEPNFHLLYHPSHLSEPELGTDGYDPDFAPPNPYIDRVWAKGKIEFFPNNLIKTGQKIDLVTQTNQIDEKISASKGPMTCIDLLKEYSNELGVCLKEYRTLCYFLSLNDQIKFGYRQADKSTESNLTSPLKNSRGKKASKMQVQVHPNSVLLFRYSALTFNAHKIHYDYKYATEVEGYPGCLVHGPLTTTLCLKLLTQYMQANQMDWTQLKTFDYRLFQPLYNDQPFTIHLRSVKSNQIEIWVENYMEGLAFRGTANF